MAINFAIINKKGLIMGFTKLVIVESPIKAKTIQKFLNSAHGSSYLVLASGGHIKDLPKKSLGIHNNKGEFRGDYYLMSAAKPFIQQVKNQMKNCEDIFVCTDDDREGEAICEDIVKTCNIKDYYRFAPREITKDAIITAIVEKVGIRKIDKKIVTAQRVRRQEDRIYGYMLSPVIRWYTNIQKKDDIVTHGTGRVEALALDILYERHKIIEAYKNDKPLPTDFIKASYKYKGIPFELKGDKLDFKKTENEELEQAKKIARSNPHIVYSITPNIEDYSPPPPFITSSLYSTASYVYGFEPEFTKKLAQELFYCGVINYPRTDSYQLSHDCYKSIVAYLKETISIENHSDILKEKRFYKNKKGAQAAHEAIRPIKIDVLNSPPHVRSTWDSDAKTKKLGENHYKLYELIWASTISTQFIDSSYDQKEMVVRCGSLIFKDKANMCIVRGWEKYYGIILNETKKDDKEDWKNREKIMPDNLHVGQVLDSVTIDSYEKPSRAPKRISMGKLISMLETIQVARPSTMHTISQKIIKKGYANSNSTLLTLTESGVFVAMFNSNYAHELVDRKKASEFEAVIQKIENGEITNTNEILKSCWDYIKTVKQRVGFIEREDRCATAKQIELAKKFYENLPEEKKREVDISDFNNQEKVSLFIQKHKEDEKQKALQHTIGICPKCKKESVVNTDKTIKCLTDKCNFIVFKDGIKKFLASMEKEFNEEELIAIFSTILEDRIVFITGLKTKFGNKDSYFELKYNKQFKNYSFSFFRTDAIRDTSKGLWEQKIAPIPSNKEVVELKKKIKKLNNENKRLQDESRKDTLTRANNRAALESDLSKLLDIKDHPKINGQIYVAFLDGDKFKDINDNFGHGTGDEVLQTIVNECFNEVRSKNIPANVYRYGGDEFVILFYGISDNTVLQTLQNIKENVSQKEIGSAKVKTSISLGYAQYELGDDLNLLCDKADQALYVSKGGGRNSINKYSVKQYAAS